ncbi:hypothetical protein WG906_08840 [Pedobacter sp. P351]|uniref:hypothetical protein n=1 Tax=Pedobacter superstes TaxID=3133441 RepID=UPI0030B29052
MGFFDNQKQNGSSTEEPSLKPFQNTVESETIVQPIPERIFIERELSGEKKISPNNYVPTADNNINLLFAFLDKNHEENGYNDALVNPDSSHLQQNLDALKNELSRTIRKVRTFYEDFITEINFHIESRSRSGMIDTVQELTMKKDIAQSHIKKVIEIEADAKEGTGESQGIVISYTRGFKNGLAAISHHTILKRNL